MVYFKPFDTKPKQKSRKNMSQFMHERDKKPRKYETDCSRYNILGIGKSPYSATPENAEKHQENRHYKHDYL